MPRPPPAVYPPSVTGQILGILTTLSERRFLQIVGAFVAAGWIAVEATDMLVSRGKLPEMANSLLILWYAGGILPIMVLGWFHGAKGRQAFSASELGLLTAILLTVGALSIRTVRSSIAIEAQAGIVTEMDLSTVAVLYFRFVGDDPDRAFVAEGMTEALIQELSTVRNLHVISRNGVRPFRGTDLTTDSIARALGAGTIVEGTVEDRGEMVRVSVALVDGDSGAEIKRSGFERPSQELLDVQDALAGEVALQLRAWLGQEVQLRMMGHDTESLQAWANLQRGKRAQENGLEHLMAGRDAEAAEAYAGAKSFFDRASNLDPGWPEPHTAAAFLAYRMSRQAENLDGALQAIDEGQAAAEAALELDPRHARSMELRGTITYWKWLMGVTADPTARAEELRSARADLERAVELEPTLASAYSTLSHLYYADDVASAVLAARRAYEEDAYLEVANDVLSRLFNGSLDLVQFAQAERWCMEGQRRFPDDYRFSLCELQLMATPALDPDVDRGWELVARIEGLLPEPWLGYQRAEDRLFQGGVLARAGLADSARSVLRSARSEVTHDDDPSQDLLAVEAAMWVVAGDPDQAIALLRRYIAANPEHEFSRGGDVGWWWQDLRAHPEFSSLTGG